MYLRPRCVPQCLTTWLAIQCQCSPWQPSQVHDLHTTSCPALALWQPIMHHMRPPLLASPLAMALWQSMPHVPPRPLARLLDLVLQQPMPHVHARPLASPLALATMRVPSPHVPPPPPPCPLDMALRQSMPHARSPPLACLLGMALTLPCPHVPPPPLERLLGLALHHPMSQAAPLPSGCFLHTILHWQSPLDRAGPLLPALEGPGGLRPLRLLELGALEWLGLRGPPGLTAQAARTP